MTYWIATVRLDKNPDHDPRNKVTGACPIGMGGTSTDVTGEHHSVLVNATNVEEARKAVIAATGIHHITRIEEV